MVYIIPESLEFSQCDKGDKLLVSIHLSLVIFLMPFIRIDTEPSFPSSFESDGCLLWKASVIACLCSYYY